MRVDQKIARKCYENSLRNQRSMYTITTQLGGSDVEVESSHCEERQPRPVGEVREVEINSKKFKLGTSLQKELEEIVEVISKNMNAFAWSFADLLKIDPDFLCYCLMMDEKAKPVV